MRIAAMLFLLSAAAMAGPAWAEDGPRFCPNRPDLDTATCTTDVGRVMVEVSAMDLQQDRGGGERHDTLLIGDLQLRTGIGPSTELQFGWTALGHEVDRVGGDRQSVTGTGDIRLGMRQNLLNPDGDALSIAVEGYATLPVGRQPIGRDGASFGVVLPVSYELNDTWDLALTAQASAEPNEEGDGRHAALSGIAGIGYAISDAVHVVGELAVTRDDDPADRVTQTLAAASIAWQVRPLVQLDMLVTAGLNHDTPDARIAVGGEVLF